MLGTLHIGDSLRDEVRIASGGTHVKGDWIGVCVHHSMPLPADDGEGMGQAEGLSCGHGGNGQQPEREQGESIVCEWIGFMCVHSPSSQNSSKGTGQA